MIISSRTPEGQPNHCPVCDADVRIDPSPLFGDATCPRCGSLLWFLNIQPHTHIFQRSRSNSIRDRVIQIVAEQLGVDADRINKNPSLVNDLGADSLDTVELVMELEEEFDLDAVNASVGDRVRVVSGHFENFEGTVDTIDRESGRVTIGITIFGRTTLVELESWEVQRIGA